MAALALVFLCLLGGGLAGAGSTGVESRFDEKVTSSGGGWREHEAREVLASGAVVSVNPIVGHLSDSGSQATEHRRIQEHLRWVLRELRRADNRHPARTVLLEVLERYSKTGRFPRHDHEVDGRLPRFVDARGNRCAVAELIHASGEHALLQGLATRHEYDYIAAMPRDELEGWGARHGFLLRELEMIQPTYEDGGGVHVPTRFEEREAERRRRREAKRPRPLRREQIDYPVDRLLRDEARRTCFGTATGRFRVRSSVEVLAGSRIRVRVRVRDVESGVRKRGMGRCLTQHLRSQVRTVLRSANHTVRRPIRVRTEAELHLPTPAEVAEALIALDYSHRPNAMRTSRLRECLSEREAPLTLTLRVASWNGYISVVQQPGHDWTELERCALDLMTYGQVEPRPARDVGLTVEVQTDGSLRLLDAPSFLPLAEP